MIPLLLTRPTARSERFFTQLDADVRAGLKPVFAPMWRMEQGQDAPDFDVALFTSANGVHFGPEAAGRTAYCIGAATADKARAAGWKVIASGQDADALVETILKVRPTGRLMHVGGARTRGAVAERLAAAGLNAERHVAYVQHPLPLSVEARDILAKGNVIVPLFSPDGAAHFVKQAGRKTDVHIAAISHATALELGDFAATSVLVAEDPNAKSMADAVGKLLYALQSG
ncbi:MAG: uroporphyrinogen-III synthase [Pseudomonadota bacterium]